MNWLPDSADAELVQINRRLSEEVARRKQIEQQIIQSERLAVLGRLMVDVIILDSPPATIVADAVVLSKRVDGVVLVVEANRTRRDAVKQAIFKLQQAGGNLFGAVLNRVPGRRGSYYYEGYYVAREPAYESQVEWMEARATRPQQLPWATSSRDKLNGDKPSKNGRDNVVFSFTNSRGKTYFLHGLDATADSNHNRTLYFFASEIRDNPLAEVPAGYPVHESHSGLPVLKKAE